jgi:hypothetical protein
MLEIIYKIGIFCFFLFVFLYQRDTTEKLIFIGRISSKEDRYESALFVALLSTLIYGLFWPITLPIFIYMTLLSDEEEAINELVKQKKDKISVQETHRNKIKNKSPSTIQNKSEISTKTKKIHTEYKREKSTPKELIPESIYEHAKINNDINVLKKPTTINTSKNLESNIEQKTIKYGEYRITKKLEILDPIDLIANNIFITKEWLFKLPEDNVTKNAYKMVLRKNLINSCNNEDEKLDDFGNISISENIFKILALSTILLKLNYIRELNDIELNPINIEVYNQAKLIGKDLIMLKLRHLNTKYKSHYPDLNKLDLDISKW